MAWLKLTMQLFFLGASLVLPAYSQQPPCEIVRKTVAQGSFRLDVDPLYYEPGAIYTVSVTGAEKATSVILQIVPPENSSGGSWEEEHQTIHCSATESVMQKNFSGPGTQIRWRSPRAPSAGSAQIRAFVSFVNGTTLLRTKILEGELVTSMSSSVSQPTSSPHKPTLHSNPSDVHLHLNTTTVHHNFASSHQWTKDPHSSVSVAQASSFLLTILQLLSISLGYKLLT
ncbi:placenta-expressed transcript 1 protein [Python bivittatus]|uniref:Placenta-expressed transcript 1 protein n=1 Tax=Python bivittatus TaxID=176946 RepID=A0A9F2NH13_PYTBI|nr:placenta-expressed transcript 1 protein [Python bivittatus]